MNSNVRLRDAFIISLLSFHSGIITRRQHSIVSVSQLFGDWALYWKQKSLWSSDSIEEAVNLPPYEYSSFHKHLNRSFRGNRPWGQSQLDKSLLASCYCRHEVWSFPEAALRLSPSSFWRTDWSGACKADSSASSVHFLIIHHLDFSPEHVT